jgi:hypothetical protein
MVNWVRPGNRAGFFVAVSQRHPVASDGLCAKREIAWIHPTDIDNQARLFFSCN